MERKYFPLDKNHLLERAQLEQEELLIRLMVDQVKDYYLTFCNPLGLEDDIIVKLRKHTFNEAELFSEFYKDLCGIYRYLKGENQLELLFDGSDHFSKYTNDWGMEFCNWVNEFCQSKSFINAVFALTVLKPAESRFILKTNRLKYFLENHFHLKIYKYKGILKVA
ncbi:MAG: hypothetical protein ACNS60_19700 [Candidatus Cyclobacteriaceae bacterium M2_1C_046]